ncbi:hypothetical protein FIBSPDRAFT_184143 [Athelia psychrophila]|uniref:Uncharacterized protein n=1 Tax=Athelia psychrophila TaxID=1759441 RepID=A0A166AFA4_9AGAM|nr:hypothetical protein FIBSPDRAFT_184143 [Fibularhizoctonia sp. CBS 109695]
MQMTSVIVGEGSSYFLRASAPRLSQAFSCHGLLKTRLFNHRPSLQVLYFMPSFPRSSKVFREFSRLCCLLLSLYFVFIVSLG